MNHEQLGALAGLFENIGEAQSLAGLFLKGTVELQDGDGNPIARVRLNGAVEDELVVGV